MPNARLLWPNPTDLSDPTRTFMSVSPAVPDSLGVDPLVIELCQVAKIARNIRFSVQ